MATSVLSERGLVRKSLLNANTLYVAKIGVGHPRQIMSLQLDTGSSDMWLPDARSSFCTGSPQCVWWGSFDPSLSMSYIPQVNTGGFSIRYGDKRTYEGSWSSDSLTIGSATLGNISFAVVDKAVPAIGYINGFMGISFEPGHAQTKLGN